MPKQVDHEERRRRIAEALWRIAGDGGLEAASLSEVAAEAGVSKGMLQHYFENKNTMMIFASGYLADRISARVRRHLERTPEPASAASTLRSLVLGLLPADEDSRTETLVANAFFQRALSQSEVAGRFREGRVQLLDLLATHVSAAQADGELRADLEPRREAEILLAMVGGLGDDLLLGHRTMETVMSTVDYYLDRLGSPEQDSSPQSGPR